MRVEITGIDEQHAKNIRFRWILLHNQNDRLITRTRKYDQWITTDKVINKNVKYVFTGNLGSILPDTLYVMLQVKYANIENTPQPDLRLTYLVNKNRIDKPQIILGSVGSKIIEDHLIKSKIVQ